MGNKATIIITALIFFSFTISAQVQVRDEPRHKKVLENNFIRLLDVNMAQGDTSLFHIHSTPSVFVHFTNTLVCSQLIGKEWVKAKNTKGNADFVSFFNNIRVHRVSNCDTAPFHVMDAEILSAYDTSTKKRALPFIVLYDNEKVFTYRLTKNNFTTKPITQRGPMIAELVSGDKVYYVDKTTKQETAIKAGGYLYIEPNATFQFKFKGKEKPDMVLIEIK